MSHHAQPMTSHSRSITALLGEVREVNLWHFRDVLSITRSSTEGISSIFKAGGGVDGSTNVCFDCQREAAKDRDDEEHARAPLSQHPFLRPPHMLFTVYPFISVAEVGFLHVDRAGLKLLTSHEPPTSASQNAGITEYLGLKSNHQEELVLL
ncbi:hypothetical protein AAY473_001100 [Plecturocebus cupreus]